MWLTIMHSYMHIFVVETIKRSGLTKVETVSDRAVNGIVPRRYYLPAYASLYDQLMVWIDFMMLRG